MEELKRRAFTAEFKIEAVKWVTQNGLSYAEVGRRLDVLPKLIKAWEDTYRAGKLIAGAPRLRVTAEQMELSKLRKEVQELKYGARYSKKGRGVLCEDEQVKYAFIEQPLTDYPMALGQPLNKACTALSVTASGFHAWKDRPEAQRT